MNMSLPTKICIGALIWCCVLLARFVYFGYMKAPKEIELLKSQNKEDDVKKWEDFRDKCRIYAAVTIAIIFLSLIIFVS